MREDFEATTDTEGTRYIYYPVIEYKVNENTVKGELGSGSNPPAYSIGDTVEILEIFKIGDKSWGCTKNGWICMDYVVASDSASDAGAVEKTVTASCLRIRSDAGLDKSIVGHLYRGDTVKVFESKEADSMIWWRMDSGWISGDYLQ